MFFLLQNAETAGKAAEQTQEQVEQAPIVVKAGQPLLWRMGVQL